MACEKGATYLDKLCHKFYDEPKGRGEKTDYVCRICGGPLEAYYCEERLYLVRCVDCGTLALVKTANPRDSARVTLARPALTPPNEALTLEEVAEILAEQFGDECACNVNGNDEWLPMMCHYGDVCPDPPEHLGCWMELLRNKYRRPPEGEA